MQQAVISWINSERSNFRHLCVTMHRLTPHPDIKYVGTPGLNDALRLYLSNLLSSEIILLNNGIFHFPVYTLLLKGNHIPPFQLPYN